MTFKMTTELQWKNAIDCWRGHDPGPLKNLLKKVNIPDTARTFLVELVEGNARRRRGRPKLYNEAQKLRIASFFRERLILHQFKKRINSTKASETPKDMALADAARRFNIGSETVSAFVYSKGKNRGNK